MSTNPTLPLGIWRHMLGVIEILKYVLSFDGLELLVICQLYGHVLFKIIVFWSTFVNVADCPVCGDWWTQHFCSEPSLWPSRVGAPADHIVYCDHCSLMMLTGIWKKKKYYSSIMYLMFQSPFLSMLKDFWQSFAIKTGIEMKEDIEGNVYCFSKNFTKTFVWMKKGKKLKFHWLKA